jgi:FtsH-binding integral membrane protein
MFVGHFAIGFGAKRWAPKTSVGTLVFAALLADLLVFLFVAAGIEHISIQPGITRINALNLYDFAWSHSLVMDIVWGALLAVVYFLSRRHRRAAWVLFAAVLSHWVLDWASHRPDMPLAPGFHRYYGLGLYNSPLGLLIVEGGLWVIGIILYLRATRARGFAGRLVLWTFIMVFTALWFLSFTGAAPPSLHVLVTVDLILFPIVFAWAYWIDHLRLAKETSQLPQG